jgi:hypothetical protein
MAPILWALWGSPLQGLRVFFDAVRAAALFSGLAFAEDDGGAGGEV